VKKSGVVYKGMARYRRKFLAINLFLTLLYIFYIIIKLPYIKTEMFGPEKLDVDRLFNETGTIKITEFVDLGRKDKKTPEANHLKKTSYWQDDAYLYTFKADKVENTGVVFKGKVTSYGSNETTYEDMYDVYIAEIRGRKFALLAFSGQEVKKDMTAYIVHMQKPVLSAVSSVMEDDEAMEISNMILDVRDVEMEAASSDFAFVWIYLAGILFLHLKLLRYYINPLTTPTYTQLSRYGDIETVAEEIDRQYKLPSARRNRKEVILDEYILSKSPMKMKVVINHTAKN